MPGHGALRPPQLITAVTGAAQVLVTSRPEARPCAPLRGQPGDGCHRLLGVLGDTVVPRSRSRPRVQDYGAESGGRGLSLHGRGLPPRGRGHQTHGRLCCLVGGVYGSMGGA